MFLKNRSNKNNTRTQYSHTYVISLGYIEIQFLVKQGITAKLSYR